MERKKVEVENIEDGMIAAEEVSGQDGRVIVRAGMHLDSNHLTLLKRAGVQAIDVDVPDTAPPEEPVHIDQYPEYLEDLKNARLMIVDDSKLLRLKLNKILTAAGLNVVGEAENGREAVEKAEELQPTLITMDIEMPEMNGLEAIEPVLHVAPDAKIIMVSSLGEEDKIIDSISRGALDFITKPFDQERVKKAVIAMIIVQQHH